MEVTVTVDGVTVVAVAKTVTIREAREAERQLLGDALEALFDPQATRDDKQVKLDDLTEVEGWALFGARQRALISASIISQQ